VPFAEQLHQVGLEDHTDRMGERARPVLGNAELGADRALATIGGHQIARADGACGAIAALADGGADARVVLIEGDQLGRITQIGAQLLGMGTQNWLQHVLGDQAAADWTGRGKVGAHVFHRAVILLADQAFHDRNDVVFRERWFHLTDGGRDADRLEQLQGAGGQAGDAWMDRGTVMALHQ